MEKRKAEDGKFVNNFITSWSYSSMMALARGLGVEPHLSRLRPAAPATNFPSDFHFRCQSAMAEETLICALKFTFY